MGDGEYLREVKKDDPLEEYSQHEERVDEGSFVFY